VLDIVAPEIVPFAFPQTQDFGQGRRGQERIVVSRCAKKAKKHTQKIEKAAPLECLKALKSRATLTKDLETPTKVNGERRWTCSRTHNHLSRQREAIKPGRFPSRVLAAITDVFVMRTLT
jgi:hypothetical protein